MLSGVLACGVCESDMVVVGTKRKNGRRYPVFGCAAHRSKGEAICPNALTVSKNKLSLALFGVLHDLVEGNPTRGVLTR